MTKIQSQEQLQRYSLCTVEHLKKIQSEEHLTKIKSEDYLTNLTKIFFFLILYFFLNLHILLFTHQFFRHDLTCESLLMA